MRFAQGHSAGQWQNLGWKNAEWVFIFIAGSFGLQGDPCWSSVAGQNAALQKLVSGEGLQGAWDVCRTVQETSLLVLHS